MKRWNAVVGIALLFALGFLSGLTLATWRFRSELRAGPFPGPRISSLEQGIEAELNLDESQEEVFQEAIREAREELLALRSEARPKIEEILKRAQDKITLVLSEEQRQQLEQLLSEQRGRPPRRPDKPDDKG